MSFVYISTGNSDDKLTQHRWSMLLFEINKLIEFYAEQGIVTIHGRWYSSPVTAYQNACFGIEFTPPVGNYANALKDALRGIATEFHQDSIAWAEVNETDFLKG